MAIAELLIKNGADIHAKDNDGKTPLHVAEQYRNHELAKFLRDHDAKLK